MSGFLKDDFLLTTDTAKRLYRDSAAKMPIIDYHCHVSPKEIYEDRHFSNITEVWLGGDHYKWRIMRSDGVSEDYITGDKYFTTRFEGHNLVRTRVQFALAADMERKFDVMNKIVEETAQKVK